MTSPSIFVFLSHDVDWGKEGAPKSHIMARRDRFDKDTLKRIDDENPYQNIPDILDIEEELGLRSTFFFRASTCSGHPPPPYNLEDYKPDIRSMLSGGWEVGLHSDLLSHDDLSRLGIEKRRLEEISNTEIYGNRTHYTIHEEQHGSLLGNLKELGFRYDTSILFDRERITQRNFGFYTYNGVKVFPITLMDTLIFRNIDREVDVVRKVKLAVKTCERLPSKRVMTIIWHNCSLKMKFGRKYRDVLEYLASRRNVLIKKGIEISRMIDGGEIQGS